MKVFQLCATLFGLTIVVSTAHAKPGDTPPADPPPPLKVLEQNLDDDGWIKVHEQGTAKVDIQNSSLDVNATVDDTVPLNVNVTNGPLGPASVSVTNFPVQQSAPMPTVTRAHYFAHPVDAGASANFTFGPDGVDMVLINLSSGVDDDFVVSLFAGEVVPGEDLIGFSTDIDELPTLERQFFYPINVQTMQVTCTNLSDGCFFSGVILGFDPAP